MDDGVYKKLAEVLHTLPNGFPPTESEIEIRLLKKLFTPEDADLFCDLRLSFEKPEEIAARTGRDLDETTEKLESMRRRGLVFGIDFGIFKVYRMLPWVFGLYEFHIQQMDREFMELCEAYYPIFSRHFFGEKPQLMQVIPVEKELKNNQESLPFEKASAIIEAGKSFGVNDCICKKGKHLLNEGCDKPLEVCLAIAPIRGVFKDHPLGMREISKQEAYDILHMAEEAGLVHLASNIQSGHYYICNCCGCCCGVLRSINEMDLSESIHSNYHARIDASRCEGCGVCADERCQVHAIVEREDGYAVDQERCIGCGLCVSTCPADAIQLIRKTPEEQILPPVDEYEWNKMRGEYRAVDFSRFK